MKSFKSIREEALKKVQTTKVFDNKSSSENEKDQAFSKKGKEAKDDSGKLEYCADKNKVHVTEAATVKTGKYSWGTMKTVHHGSDFSIPLHPEHQEAIAKLKDEQEHKFKDETGHHWVARRKGDDIHFDTTGNGSLKTQVPMKSITEDIDQNYADWQDSVKKKNPEHAENIKFKSNPDQRHVISAEHGDRSFGTFNMKTGESDHLGEQAIRFVNGADPYGHTFGVGAVRHDLSNIKTKKQELPRDRPIADIDPDWEKEQAEKRKKQGVKEEALDNKADLKAKIAHHEAKALEANKQGDDEMVKHHQDKINKIKTKMANLVRNEETENLDEISKSTLVSYIKKAARSAADASNVAGFKAGQKQPKYNVSDETPEEIKRHKGIALAARKLSK